MDPRQLISFLAWHRLSQNWKSTGYAGKSGFFPLAQTHFSAPQHPPPTQKVHNSNHEFRVVEASILLFANPKC